MAKKEKKSVDAIPVIAPLLDDESISDAYAVIDNDLARDNIENDLSAADREDL